MKIAFLISLIVTLNCVAQNEQLDKDIKRLINQTDISDAKSIKLFINKVSSYGQKSIPVLLKSWETSPTNRQLFLIGEAICQIGDNSLYSKLYEIFISAEDLRTKQALASLLFRIHLEGWNGDNKYGEPRPEILEIALFSMADTTIEFENPDMANLAMLSFAGFEIYTLDIIKEKVYAEGSFTRGDFKSLQTYLTKWYRENKNNLIWDSEKHQFVLKS